MLFHDSSSTVAHEVWFSIDRTYLFPSATMTFFAHFKDFFIFTQLWMCVRVCWWSWLWWLVHECNVSFFTIRWPRAPQQINSAVPGNATVFANCKRKDTPILFCLKPLLPLLCICVCACVRVWCVSVCFCMHVCLRDVQLYTCIYCNLCSMYTAPEMPWAFWL